MNKFAGTILLVGVCVGVSFAQTPAPAPAKAPSVSQSVKQLEQDWTDAMKAGDADKVGEIVGDDWVGLQPDGTKETKTEMLAEIKTGQVKIASAENGPMEVKVLGNVAVVQGSDTEKSMYKGKDTSGKYVWMDVFVKRGDKWVAVRSQLSQLK